jgi:hypothetical protein
MENFRKALQEKKVTYRVLLCKLKKILEDLKKIENK